MLNNVKIHNRLSLLVIGSLLVCLQAGAALALKPHVRDGWQVGFSYGYSEGNIDWGELDQGAYEGGAVPQIRFGKMISSSFALSLDYHGWMLEKGEVPVKLRSSLQSISLAGTWYPGRPESTLGGLYLRGGVGYAWAGITFVEIDEEPQDHVPLEQEHGDRTDESGLGLHFQLGYEWRVSRSFAAGLGLGIDYLSINKFYYNDAYYFPMTLTGTWYW